MKIAIIGGSGLMGPHLVKQAVAAGHNVTCLNRTGASSQAPAIRCDRRESEQLKESLEQIQPDLVIDMVPFTRNDAQSLVNVIGSGSATQVIAISSIDVYIAYGRLHRTELGPYQPCPISEADPLRGKISFQGESYDKLGVEEIYRDNFPNLSILRMPAIYGWPDRSRIEEYIDAANSLEKTLRIHPKFAKWGFTRASAVNCAHAVFLCIGLSGQNIFNVGETELLTEENWCREVWKAMDIEGTIQYDETHPIPFNVDLSQGWHVDTSKIRSQLGYKEIVNRQKVLQQAIGQISSITKQPMKRV
ncbi:sugar nucleotide-binding protein [Puniceicoccaceae bacterium K14]|nr:sugar nucleotide-binding protein [Puniceicoccaceae bacterium K14]